MRGRQACSEPSDPRLLRRPGIGVLPGSRSGGPMPRRCPECKLDAPGRRPSAPRPLETDSGGRWLRVHLERPGVLLLRRLGFRRPGGVAVAMFGPAGWACSSAEMSISFSRICMHRMAYSLAACDPLISDLPRSLFHRSDRRKSDQSGMADGRICGGNQLRAAYSIRSWMPSILASCLCLGCLY